MQLFFTPLQIYVGVIIIVGRCVVETIIMVGRCVVKQ
jgi:hypothetical protein